MMDTFSYLEGQLQKGKGDPTPLLNPATEDTVGNVYVGGVDVASALQFVRDRGIPALAAMSFAERGELLSKMAAVIHENRDALIETSIANGGTTRGGAKFDIDGASGTLAAYASFAKELADSPWVNDGDSNVPLHVFDQAAGQTADDAVAWDWLSRRQELHS